MIMVVIGQGKEEVWYIRGEDGEVDPGAFDSWIEGMVVVEGRVGEESNRGIQAIELKGTPQVEEWSSLAQKPWSQS